MLKFLIADDHEIVRIGLRQILLEGFPDAHIDEATDTDSLIKKAKENNWSAVISDFAMPGGGAVVALQKIREFSPDLPVLIVSIHPEEEYANHLMRAGANGFLNKNIAYDELVAAVKHILSGKKYINN